MNRIYALSLAALLAAQLSVAQDDSQQMIRQLQEQARQNPERLDVRMSLGNVAVEARNYDLAIDAFQGVLAALDSNSPEAGDVHLRLGEIHRRKGDLGKAAESLRRAQQLLPANPVVSGTLALVLDGAGKYSEAESAYRATLELDSENAVAMNNLAYLLTVHGGRLEEALALAIKAGESDADSAEFADTLAVVHTKMGHLAEAQIILLRLVDSEPANNEFRQHLASVLEQKPVRSADEQGLLEALKAEASVENQRQVGKLVKKVRK